VVRNGNASDVYVNNRLGGPVQVMLALNDVPSGPLDLTGLAADRIATEITEADQNRLITRYLEQVKR